MPDVGERAPDFTLKSNAGEEVSLSEFLGRKKILLVFFYLAWTPI